VNATDVVLLLSIVVPVTVTIVLAWVFLRGKRDDPDEQRWRRLDEQRRAAERDRTAE
jgi:hypothetical protein